jgi:DNA end-binding protein Ku
VTIPVKLYLATESTSIGFHLLHETCLNRIQMKIYCPYHDEVISRSDTVRGYEWSKGKYVVITDEDLENVPLKTVRAIEIEKFVKASEAEESAARFVKQEYYLEPDEIGRKAFYLLKSVLADGDTTAICKIVLRDREQLCALTPYAETLLLTTLHWPDEIRSLEDLELPEESIQIKDTERKMAEQLVASMTGEFDPNEYTDEYREALMGVIEAKVGGEVPQPAAQAEPTRIGDLMAALEASVAAAREGRKAPAEGESKARAAGDASRGEAKGSRRAAPKKAAGGGSRGRKSTNDGAEEERPARRRKTA